MRFVAIFAAQAALLAAVITAVFLAPRYADGLFVPLVAVLVILPMLWFLISSLSPTSARKCPQCSADAFAPSTPGTEYGMRCSACGFDDPKAPTGNDENSAQTPPGPPES